MMSNFFKQFVKRLNRSEQSHSQRQTRLSKRKTCRRLALENLEERALLAVVAGSEFAAALTPASATLIVTTLADVVDDTDGVLSLREAIAAASAGDTVTFDAALANGTITLAGNELSITQGITIDASELDGGITLNANKKSRVLNISGGSEGMPVNLYHLTITGGKVTGNSGGGIYNSGKLMLTNCIIVGNNANRYGGGIYNTGKLTLTNCVIMGNYTSSCGGGIYNYHYCSLTLTNCTIAGNTTSSYSEGAGGIFCDSYNVTINNTLIALNYGGNLRGTVTAISHSYITSDPGFVIAPVFNDYGNLMNLESLDLRLKATSDLINAGDNSLASTNTDLDGNSRIYDGVVDIGAYEYQETLEERETVSLVVTTADDTFDSTDGKISLREAIFYAKDGETITFDASLSGKTITLTGAELFITVGITVDASALEESVTISGNNTSRVFYILEGPKERPVNLSHLTITGGKIAYYDYGGGINNYGTLTLTNCVISGNSAHRDGGGINNFGKEITLTNCVIKENSASSGGGISNWSGTSILENCVFVGNTAGNGGGAYIGGGSLILTNCTIAGNSSYDSGGGIFGNGSAVEKLILNNTLIALNYRGEISCASPSAVSHSCLASDPGFVTAPIFDDQGNLTNLETLDLHLKKTSWLINTGDSSLISTSVDIDGNSRMYDGAVDIGAYEYQEKLEERGTASLIVTTTDDSFDAFDGKTSLREAIFNAKTSEIISFDSVLSGKTIILGGEELYICNGITIDASSLEAGITISGNNTSGVFSVLGGTKENPVTFCNLTITEGNNNNSGGGIYSWYGMLALTNCVIKENSANSFGGGIYSMKGELWLTNCAITENSASRFYGGAIYTYSSTYTMINCSITENTANDYSGGIGNNNGKFTLTNCAIEKNISDGVGGGIYNCGEFKLTNCIIAENSSNNSGGGIYSWYGTITLTNCTLVKNTSNNIGGGIGYNSNNQNEFYFYNTIVAQNTAVNQDDDIYKEFSNGKICGYNNLSSFTAWTESESGNNLVYDSTAPLFKDAENGDYTLCAGSQAIDKGNNAYVASEKDLAGKIRIDNKIVDIGAYEYQTAKTPLTAPTELVYTSYGANRVLLTWNAVEQATSYTVLYSSDGTAWVEVTALSNTTTITGLTYGTFYSYKVRALAAEESVYCDSADSAIIFYRVCPMDINNGGSIDIVDYMFLSKAWFSGAGTSNWDPRADIDGDGVVGPGDFTFLSANWQKKTDDMSMIYPAAQAVFWADGDFIEELENDLDIDWNVF